MKDEVGLLINTEYIHNTNINVRQQTNVRRTCKEDMTLILGLL